MVYLGYLDGHDLGPGTAGPWVELVSLRPGLVLIDSPESRSRVYHGLKDQLPEGTPLLVAHLDEIPKFKGMREGALRWCRERLPGRADP
jgi:hypothetical protein